MTKTEWADNIRNKVDELKKLVYLFPSDNKALGKDADIVKEEIVAEMMNAPEKDVFEVRKDVVKKNKTYDETVSIDEPININDTNPISIADSIPMDYRYKKPELPDMYDIGKVLNDDDFKFIIKVLEDAKNRKFSFLKDYKPVSNYLMRYTNGMNIDDKRKFCIIVKKLRAHFFPDKDEATYMSSIPYPSEDFYRNRKGNKIKRPQFNDIYGIK